MRLRVTLLAAGLFAVTLGVAAFVLLRALEDDLVDDVRSDDIAALRAQAAQVTSQGVPAGAIPVPTQGGEAFELPVTGRHAAHRACSRATGDVVTGTPERRGTRPPGYDVAYAGSVPMAQTSVLGISGDVADYTVVDGRRRRVHAGDRSPLDSVRETIATTKRLLWIAGPALVALVAGLAWLLAGRALRPVHAVTSRVAAIGSRSLHERVPVPASGDEIAELASTMNGMLARLETASTTNRRLVSDASHELRTPVAVMRAELEVARRSATRRLGRDRATCCWPSSTACRASSTTSCCWRAATSGRCATTSFSIADVARDIGARARRVPVDVTVGDDVDPVVGDRAAVGRAVDHLVANAARHAAIGGARRGGRPTDGDDVVIVVDDDGPGIPAAKRGDVVRRFVRLDEGRARDGGGAGLGLAVTSDVATAHGGRLEIGDAPLGGARLTLGPAAGRPGTRPVSVIRPDRAGSH